MAARGQHEQGPHGYRVVATQAGDAQRLFRLGDRCRVVGQVVRRQAGGRREGAGSRQGRSLGVRTVKVAAKGSGTLDRVAAIEPELAERIGQLQTGDGIGIAEDNI
jgi:hypothetical protein